MASLLKKKDLKRFVKTYRALLKEACDLYNAKHPDNPLDAEKAAQNQMYIAPPVGDSIDVIRVGRESNLTLFDLVRIKTKDIVK